MSSIAYPRLLSGIISFMTLLGITQQTTGYVVNTPVFAGPLDLLLQLIERAELDITKLALAQVTDQYLSYLNRLSDENTEEVSAFLVIASKLLQIKSEALLPRPPVREEGEEDPGEALARQLIIYKKVKETASFLIDREESHYHTYLRLAPIPKTDTKIEIEGLVLEDLLQVVKEMFARTEKPPLGTVVTPPKITIREKINLISTRLQKDRRITFNELFSNNLLRLDVVVTFLALLELVKRHLVMVTQESLFGDIELELSREWESTEPFDLEFGE